MRNSNLYKYRFYVDNNNNLHIIKDGSEAVVTIDYHDWIDMTIEHLENIDEWYDDNLEEEGVYPISEFVEFEVDDNGYIRQTLLKEKTVDEIVEEIIEELENLEEWS